eukprot:gb/GFBE01065670.1/.p1 GENE.gb/GFBE01065670.1/~~gb/GFBE01065670.1/.p1  ORF type:complete len:614 (+),score=125.52 gb/GFBE01065670.1/:1-1842(+)
MSSNLQTSMSSDAAGLPLSVGNVKVLDRTLLLRIGKLCRYSTHSAVLSLQTSLRQQVLSSYRQEATLSWRRSAAEVRPCRAQARRVAPAAERPRRLFQRPTREVKVQQLRVSAAEACSLSFDEVDPFQQEGMTRRMLVFFKSLEDSLSYWEGEEQCKVHAFELLQVPDDGMPAIRLAIMRASDLLDDRRYRCAYDALCGVRHWLPSAAAVAMASSEQAAPEPDSTLPESGSNVILLAAALESSADEVDEDASDDEAAESVSAAFARTLVAALPVKNTFIHFDLLPELPRRCRSAPSSPPLPAWDAAWAETAASGSLGHTAEQSLPEGHLDTSKLDACTPACASTPARLCRLPAQWHEDSTNASTCDDRSPRSEVTAHSEQPPDGTTLGSEMPLEANLRASHARFETSRVDEVKVRNTFVDVDDEDSDPGEGLRRCSSCPASLSHGWVPQQKRQKSHKQKKKSASKKVRTLLRSRDEVPPEQSPANCGGFFRYEWVESAEKLNGNLRLLKRRFSLPVGDFTLTLCPQGSAAGRSSGPCFQEAMGHALCSIRCESKPAPDVILALSLGGETLCFGTDHDFAKKPVFRLPKVLDLRCAIDAFRGSFTLTCTLIARP